MYHSILLAQIFGLYCFIMSILLLSRPSRFQKLVQSFDADNMMILIAGAYTLLLGIFLVVIHNIWIMHWSVIITVFAWLTLIKGIVWIGFPDKVVSASKKLYSGKAYYVSAVIVMLIGIFLMVEGFCPSYRL